MSASKNTPRSDRTLEPQGSRSGQKSTPKLSALKVGSVRNAAQGGTRGAARSDSRSTAAHSDAQQGSRATQQSAAKTRSGRQQPAKYEDRNARTDRNDRTIAYIQNKDARARKAQDAEDRRAEVEGRVSELRARREGRAQVRPTAEGWKQAMGADGRPELQFATKKRVTQPPVHFADLTLEERQAKLKELGLPGFRAKQLSVHYFQHYTTDPELMSDLPKAGRQEIVEAAFPTLLTEVKRLTTDDGATIKFLWRLFDGSTVESVLMRYPGRITLCVSSQCGCGMNCPFCATGQAGLTRNMSTAEILDQIIQANRVIAEGGLGGIRPGDHVPERVTNIVFMGMGEPLANYKRVMNAVHRMCADGPEGLGMSARGITVSTVGLVPAIKKLADEKLPFTFALSLHAPDDELRDELIPVNSRWKADEAIDAAYEYYEKTGRRVSIEYALIKDMNDHEWRADLLADKLNARGKGWVHVNPIPLNPTPGSVWTSSEPAVTRRWIEALEAKGIPTTLRDTRGKEIDGACGQLAAAED